MRVCRCEGLEPAANRDITLTLAKLARDLAHPPMAAELAQAALDAAAHLLSQADSLPLMTMQQPIQQLLKPADSAAISPTEANESTSRSSQILELHSRAGAEDQLSGAPNPSKTPWRPRPAERRPRRQGQPLFKPVCATRIDVGKSTAIRQPNEQVLRLISIVHMKTVYRYIERPLEEAAVLKSGGRFQADCVQFIRQQVRWCWDWYHMAFPLVSTLFGS